MTQIGFISKRNEDGTSWLTLVEGTECWGPRRGRRAFPISKFRELEGQVESSKKNDCPDNGFFGLWNLTWHECTQDEAHEQEIMADAFAREEAEEMEEQIAELEAMEDDIDHWGDDDRDYDDSYADRQVERYEMWRREH